MRLLTSDMRRCYARKMYTRFDERGATYLQKQIDGAKATWALEAKKNNTDTPLTTDLFGATQYIRAAPVCPSGIAAYAMVAVDTPQPCPNVAANPLHVQP